MGLTHDNYKDSLIILFYVAELIVKATSQQIEDELKSELKSKSVIYNEVVIVSDVTK